MGWKAFFDWLLAKPESPPDRPRTPLTTITHTIHRNVELLTFLGTLEDGSLSWMEHLTVPPQWDGTEAPTPAGGLAVLPPGTFAIAIVEIPWSLLSRDRHSFTSVFYGGDGQRCTRNWSSHRPPPEETVRAMLMVPPEVTHGETIILD